MKAWVWVALLGLPLMAAAAAKNPDATFYKHAAEGGMAEVELGKMAQQKGQSQDVRDYGAMMVQDHTAANEKLMSIAQSKDVDLPKSPSVGQMATKGKLDVLSGDSFDKSYIKAMVKDHVDTIQLFQKEAKSGLDPDAKAFAAATLPTLRAHLQKIRTIAAAAKVSTG